MKQRGSIITIREHKLKALTSGKSVLGEGPEAGPPYFSAKLRPVRPRGDIFEAGPPLILGLWMNGRH